MNYYDEIKKQLIKSEIYNRARDYSKDRNKVRVYYETGRLLYEVGKEYGKISLENILINLWLKLEKSIMKEHFME